MSVSATVSALHITWFQAEKIYTANKVGSAAQRQISPYRITTYKGPELGLIGSMPAVLYKLHQVNTTEAANHEDITVLSSA